MNWRLILQLSMAGLAMAMATVYVISSNIEPAFWLVIFLYCSYVIARQIIGSGNQFLHGLCLGILNSVWITTIHELMYKVYIVHHAREAVWLRIGSVSFAPRDAMLILGPIIGIASGAVIGLVALVFGKFLKPATSKVSAQ